jgi:hypothetical protein|nr:MAG TPA: hypothetical protein [Caudoviricetes sp.]
MNLWVRSQDKENLIPIKNPICVYDNKIVYKESASYIMTLAEYKTKERALEVLDEIEERIMLINTINIVKDRDSLIAYKNALTEEKIKGLGYPYQMPKD